MASEAKLHISSTIIVKNSLCVHFIYGKEDAEDDEDEEYDEEDDKDAEDDEKVEDVEVDVLGSCVGTLLVGYYQPRTSSVRLDGKLAVKIHMV